MGERYLKKSRGWSMEVVTCQSIAYCPCSVFVFMYLTGNNRKVSHMPLEGCSILNAKAIFKKLS